MIETEFIIVDLFCGAGGTTTGFERTKGLAKVIACVNHDAIAIKSHWLNNPFVKHFNEDIRVLDLAELISLVTHYRNIYPNAKLILWASLECTNFSKAKGGKPREADSRTLADHLERYIVALNPEIIQIENVVEFMSWGPLDENGKPVSKKNGVDWIRWRKEICALGYVDEWREMNAADFGAYTSRNRLFGMFAKNRSWISWPEPTHFKNPSKGNLFEAPKKWKPVKEVLDLKDEGNSIFGRKKDLSEKTLERIYAGLLKYIANDDTSFIKKYYSGRPEGKVISINGPAGTIRTSDGQAVVNACFIAKYYSSGGQLNSINEPSSALTTVNHSSVIQPEFLIKYLSNNQKTGVNSGASIENPSPTITTQNRIGIVQSCFLTNYYSSGGDLRSIDQPGPTIPTKDRISKIQTVWLDKQYSGAANHQSVDQPAGSIVSNDKHCLMRAQPFILNTNFNNIGRDINSPAPVITANRKWHYLVNPQWGSKSAKGIDKPCFTLIARMDKAPPYVVTTESGQIAIQILDSDSPATVKIKQFMAAYGIIDIKMRMLKILELLKIQGFPPPDYKLSGTQADQKKFIGNSVCRMLYSPG
ncbi:MAG: DNA cytosine methyltransferase [Chitinophagales bacterium]